MPGPIDLAPGDVIKLTQPVHNGTVQLFAEGTILFVVAIFKDEQPVPIGGGLIRPMDRLMTMPAGVLRIYDTPQWFIRCNCKRLTMWQTRSPL